MVKDRVKFNDTLEMRLSALGLSNDAVKARTWPGRIKQLLLCVVVLVGLEQDLCMSTLGRGVGAQLTLGVPGKLMCHNDETLPEFFAASNR